MDDAPKHLRLSAGDAYEIRYLAHKYGLPPEQLHGLLAEHGGDRETLEAAAQHLAQASTTAH